MGLMNKQWILEKRPVGLPEVGDVVFAEQVVPDLSANEVVVRNEYASLDPAIRGWMSDAPNYIPPIPLGTSVWATTVGRVIKSKSSALKIGDLVMGFGNWSEYSVQQDQLLMKIPDDGRFPLSNYLSVLGYTGFTAYFGLLDVGKPEVGETVVVSAAAGAVGSIVGQIAKIKGCRAVGLAGSDEKCRKLIDMYGFDAAINYKTAKKQEGGIAQALAGCCPNGIDVYFDNVGGDILDAVLMNINEGTRIPMCGAIASYNETNPVPGPYNMWQLLVKSARIEGFLVSSYIPERLDEAIVVLSKWVSEGKIKHAEHIVDGVDQCLNAFHLLFNGGNKGKLMVRIADPR